jgi:polysaccharide pyruvyl transferase WcaK-like protein
MRILIDSCAYNGQNVGDLAMLTVAVSRLRELWPVASIEVITNAPDVISRQCGEVRTVPVRGRRLLLQEHMLGPLRRFVPVGVRPTLDRREDGLRLGWPGLFAASARLKASLRGQDARDVASFLDAVQGADLLVVNGAGILTDAFKDSALGILATLDIAIRRGVPTALFGQGIGPILDTDLERRAREVLPFVAQIAVREARTSPPLLIRLGVSPSKVVVTGDDAIELAYPDPTPAGTDRALAGSNIGINIRMAPYADVDRNMLSRLKEALAAVSHSHRAAVLPIPIAHHGGRMDVETLRDLVGGDGGASIVTPQKVIARVAACRVMVSGSYHGAVFALAQGIPVVALAKSAYYVNKMAGLADQFAVGCEIVPLDRPDLPARLVEAIDRAWRTAGDVRAPLLASAADQIARSRAAYRRLRDEISSPLGDAVERLVPAKIDLAVDERR